MFIIAIQEFAGFNNLLSNLFIDRNKTTMTGVYNYSDPNWLKQSYEKYLNKLDYYSKVCSPTFYMIFNTKDLSYFKNQGEFPHTNFTKPIEDCEYVVCRGTAGGNNNAVNRGEEIPFDEYDEIIRISNIFTTPKSWYRYIDSWKEVGQERSIEESFNVVKEGMFHKPGFISLGYDPKEITWIDIDDFFVENQVVKLIKFIEQEYDIHADDITYWIVDELNKRHLSKYQNIEISEEIISRTEEFNKMLDGFKIINSKTIDKYLKER